MRVRLPSRSFYWLRRSGEKKSRMVSILFTTTVDFLLNLNIKIQRGAFRDVADADMGKDTS